MKLLFTSLLIVFYSIEFSFASEILQVCSDENPRYVISVSHGDNYLGEIEFESFPEVAPKHSANLDSLVSINFYDRTAFHRVIPNFMIQGGDPNSRDKDRSTWGFGDPSQTKVPAEFSNLNHIRGTISAARTNDPNSATSQFFICVVSTPWLDGQYSIYGQVLRGMDIADLIVNVPRDARDNPIQKVEMTIKKVDPSSVNSNVFNSGNIRIFPNPAKDYLNFQSEDQGRIINYVRISDINGKVYFHKEYALQNYLEDISISVSDFPSGVFYINFLDSEGKEFILRFVKN
ncbi:MAG: peptidylprolyl isomerase [Candidatus Kapabacteria bacterium]|nr:peptidylprolyl isomerase [Ignavibacteriota bacterium]MCW5884974.1 peptidylprolyl isomerase [Candidatus Kapabacteria bacterium]